MAAKDNREFLAELEKAGEAIRIEQEVDWDCEVGAVIRRSCEIGAPAPFFQKIKDYPGYRMAGGLLANFRRIAMAMGLPPDTPARQIINEYSNRGKNLIKPVMVKKAPCQQNVAMGKDVDLTKIPFIMAHDGDGGRYITWHFVIQKDPDTGFVNWGMYRAMLHNERLLGCWIGPMRDGGIIMSKYHKKGEGCPFAIAVAPPPACGFAGAADMKSGISEVDMAGALQGAPVELVKCKTVDLEVPANAEIVLEGHSVPDVLVDEGPFGEFTGYRATPRGPKPVFQVECITWRDNPVLTATIPGMPTDESHLLTYSIAASILYREQLRAVGIPVVDVYVPPEAAGFVVIVSCHKPFDSIPAWICDVIAGASVQGQGTAKMIIVVDHDVDPFNIGQVIHVLGTKLHPIKGVFTRTGLGGPINPYLSFQERSKFEGGRVVLDATWSVGWNPETEKPMKMSFDGTYSPELQKKVLDNWSKYGYK